MARATIACIFGTRNVPIFTHLPHLDRTSTEQYARDMRFLGVIRKHGSSKHYCFVWAHTWPEEAEQ